MKIQVVLDGRVVSTQWNIDPRAMPDLLAARKRALRDAIDNKELRISEALRASVDLVDDDVKSNGQTRAAPSATPPNPPKPKSVISFRK